jgi:hypothetical protein
MTMLKIERCSTIEGETSRAGRARFAVLGIIAFVLLAFGAALALAQSTSSRTRITAQSCSDSIHGTTCASGICIHTAASYVCSNTCTTDANCTITGWGCSKNKQPSGVMLGVCRPRG